MKVIDLTLPLGVATPAWPTYEPLQIKYFKRLAPNGANGQLLTHSNHLGTHLDGEIHFFTPGRDMASLPMDFLVHEGAIVDLSDVVADYDIYTPAMIEDKVEVKEGDILIIHTGFHHFGWDHPNADEIRYMVQHPGPVAEFAEWCFEKKLRWIGVDCGSADHPMNTIIRDWMGRQRRQADWVFEKKYKTTIEDTFSDDMYQMMHIDLFPHSIIHAECIGGDLDLVLNRRAEIGFFPWRFVDGEASIGRCVVFVEDDEYKQLMAKKEKMPKTRFGDAYDPKHVENLDKIAAKNLQGYPYLRTLLRD
jgi:kynurenine formamidase